MEDVDKIIINSLTEIGCDLDGLENLKKCDAEKAVMMTVSCLKVIQPGLNIPSILPVSMSVRFNLCAKIAQICKDLGYKGDIGYHTFLYANEADIRRVLIYLVEKLPRVSIEENLQNTESSPKSTRQVTSEVLSNFIKEYKSKPLNKTVSTKSFVSLKIETGTLLPGQKIDCKPQEWRQYVANRLPFINDQVVTYFSYIPSVISVNSQGISNPLHEKCSHIKNTHLEGTFINHVDSLFSNSITSNKQIQRISKEPDGPETDKSLTNSNNIALTNGLNNRLVEHENIGVDGSPSRKTLQIENRVQFVKDEIVTLKSRLNELRKNNELSVMSYEKQRKEENSLEQSLIIAVDADINIPKLQNINTKCKDKLEKIKIQWQQVKQPLLQDRERLQNLCATKLDENKAKIEHINGLRDDLRNVLDQLSRKRLTIEKIDNTAHSIKGSHRTEYTQKILDIIHSIKKQGITIDSVLKDTNQLHKDINSITGKIDRSFASACQLVSSSIRQDNSFPLHIRRLLIKLHQDCTDIVNNVSQTGVLVRENKESEEQILENETEKLFIQIKQDVAKAKEEQLLLKKELTLLLDR